jgi:DNA-directed RNA polymerase subunit RPC12/RpoP
MSPFLLREGVMAKYVTATCTECGFPISGQMGQNVICPNCGEVGKITGVNVPDPIFYGILGIALGVVLAKSKTIGKKLATL